MIIMNIRVLMARQVRKDRLTSGRESQRGCRTPYLPTKILPTKICRLKLSGNFYGQENFTP